VDFELSDDQLALKEGIQAFCESRFTSDKLHELADSGAAAGSEVGARGVAVAGNEAAAREGSEPVKDDSGYVAVEEGNKAAAREGVMPRQLWQELADLGVFGLGLPEESGGAGLGWVEAVVVFEELGKYLVPGPLAATYLVAVHTDGAANSVASGEEIAVGGAGRQVPIGKAANPAATGDEIAALIVAEDPPHFIEHPELADVILVQDQQDVRLLSQADSQKLLQQAELTSPLDPLTPVAKLSADLPLGQTLPDAWLQGATLASAQQLGLAVGALEQAVAYATERKQFDKPIGQFQAVKHLCADMLTAVEVARAAVYYAGALLDNPDIADVARAVSVARVTASEAAELCGRHCVQIHGGMGYTWEMDAHLFLKRAWVLDTVFGTAATHAEKLAAMY